jgi:hypothetical protein
MTGKPEKFFVEIGKPFKEINHRFSEINISGYKSRRRYSRIVIKTLPKNLAR